VLLRESEQAALRTLLGSESVPFDNCERREVLEAVGRLVPCDALGVSWSDKTGLVVDEVTLPEGHFDWLGSQACDGPLPIGLQHWSRQPWHTAYLAELGLRDTIAVGFRSGSEHVVQVWLDRVRQPFDDRAVALLSLVGPALQRLFRERPTPALPESLTTSERRVLQLVATGKSNAAIAEHLYVAPSTVRKHLEHAYRKLGVSNRYAAVSRFEGRVSDPRPSSSTMGR